MGRGIEFLRKICLIRKRIFPCLEVITPTVVSDELWKRSGHIDHFKDSMFLFKGMGIKPMNCPLHFSFAERYITSYRQLPLTVFEFEALFRKEAYGAINVPLRNSSFRQDDSHTFVLISDLKATLLDFMSRVNSFYNLLGLSNITRKITLSPNPDPIVQEANKLMVGIFVDSPLIDSIEEDNGAFYGPKIEFHIQESNDRSWQCGTIQLDLLAREKFNLSVTNSQGLEERLIVVHMALIGSAERFLGLMIDRTGGFLPVNIHPNPYRLLVFNKKYLNLLNGWLPGDFVAGPKNIRSFMRLQNLRRYRCLVFLGDREFVLGKARVQIYGAHSRYLFMLDFRLVRSSILDIFVRRFDRAFSLAGKVSGS